MNEKLNQLAEELFQCKAEKALLEQQKKEVNFKQGIIEEELDALMIDQGIEGFKSASGSCSRSVKMHASILNFETAMEWIEKTKSYHFLRKQFNDKALKEYFEETAMYPPGMDSYLKTTINTRKSK